MDTFTDGKGLIRNLKIHRNSGIPHYESILGSSMHLNHRLNIVPAKNMISNIGISADATHSVADVRMIPGGIRRIFYMDTYELQFPIKHPPYVLQDYEFLNRIDRIMGRGHPLIRIYRKFISIILRLKYKDYKGLKLSFLKLFKRKTKLK